MNREAERPSARLAVSDRLVVLVLAVVSYVPILLTDVGKVSADTKTYLTVDPGDLLRSASSMWDPSVGAGTVPHQNIGYLFPLGPYYWSMELLGVPDWLTQRLLWGTLVFAAASGTFRLLRWLGWEITAAFVAAIAYGLSPYLLSYLARLSVIIGPWAAMPWMILLAAKAARTRSWRPAAWFAIVVALVGSVNATALVFAGLAPVLWLIGDVISGRVSPTAAMRAALKIGLLTGLVSAWWIIGLSVQGSYGMPILRYTESYEAVASASTPPEVLRGLGYWFFYGGDALGNWVGPSTAYLDNVALITLGFVIAGLSLLGLLVPFPGRATASLLLFVGVTVAVGAAPLGASTIYGGFFQDLANSTIGLALRSTTRAAPLVVLPLAMGLGAASAWARDRLAERGDGERRGLAVPLAASALVVVQLAPWFTGTVLTPSILRDEDLPEYETGLASWLDDNGEGRVYELPGADFASHRWGGTVDPVLPGLIDRPYLSRELVPQGGAPTADLLNAFERRLADGWFEPESLEPVMRLLDAQTVVTRNDLEHERYRLARPGPLWTDVTSVLGDPDHAGPPMTDEPEIPFVDSLTLSRPDEADVFPAVAAFDLDPAPEVGTHATTTPTIVAGSGDGLVDLAGAGLLDTERPILYAATLDDVTSSGELPPEQLEVMVGEDPWWVVTDTNRRQGRHWSTISSNLGALETGTDISLQDDPSDNRLELFVDEITNQTIAVHRGDVADVRASYFGNQIAYTPEDAPWFALDGDPQTAWRIGVFEPTAGLRWEADLVEPASTDTITLLQPTTGAVNRFLTRVRITVDDADVEVVLDERSRTPPGQEVELPLDQFQHIAIEVLGDNVGRLSSYAGLPGVGFAEVIIPGVVDDRTVRVPDLADSAAFAGNGDAGDRTTFLFTRERIDPATTNRSAPEPAIRREFVVPFDGSYALSGELRLASDATDALLQEVLAEQPEVIADRRLHGNAGARGASALDGDPATAWSTPLDEMIGATLTIGPTEPIEVDEVSITWRSDGEHSTPAAFSIVGDDGTSVALRLEEAAEVATQGDLTTARFAVDPFRSSRIQLVVDAIEAVTSADYYSGVERTLPVALAEVSLGSLETIEAPVTIPAACRSDLLLLDGRALPVRVVGDRTAALGRGELSLEACDDELELERGSHRLDAARGSLTGLDIDRIVLDDRRASSTVAAQAPATATVEERSSTALDVTVTPAEETVWLTLNQSWNTGWRATVDGDDLGPPVLVDGYSNGWLLPASDVERVVELRWTPQRMVRIGIGLSLLGGAVTALILVAAPRRPVEEIGAPASTPLWSRRALVPAAILVLLIGVAGGPLAAIAAVATLLVLPRRRWLPAAVVLVVGGATAALIVALEWYRDYPEALFWPTQFSWAARWTWAVVASVIAASVFPRGVSRRG